MDVHPDESEWVGRIFIFGSGTSKWQQYRTWNPTHTRCASHLILSLSYHWKQTEIKLSSFPASELVPVVSLNRSHQESSWSDGKPIDLLLLRLEALLTSRGIWWEKEKGTLLLFLLDLLSEKKMKASNVFLVSRPDFGCQLLNRKRKRYHLIWISTSIHHS